MDQSKSTDLTPFDPGPSVCRSIEHLMSDGERRFLVTPMTSAIDSMRFASHCVNGGAIQLSEVPEDVIDVVSFLVHRVEMSASVGGEIESRLRLVLVSSDERCYSTLSPYAIAGWQMVLEYCGLGPYDPPIRVRPRRLKTRSGLTVLTLIVE